jgi:murein DD-endopeptidase MepM/ murein hydrolase activator NlpD
LSSEKSLLYVGQELSVGSVAPVFTTIIEKHVVEDQVVKYKTKYEFDNKMYQGQSKEKQKGSNGLNRVTQKVKMINGEISQAYIVSTEELVPMVERVVVKGGKQAPRGDGEWLWPTNIPYILSSRFGYRWGRLHAGVDICGTGRGSPIYAARAGVVTYIGYQAGGYGYYVDIKHDNGYSTRYGHMQNVNGNDRSGYQGAATKYISVGQRVEAHQVIGEMGSSGSSTGVHLHFEIRDSSNQPYNPLLFY